MVGIGPAGRVGKRAFCKTYLPTPLCHHFGESFLAAAQRLGDDDTGIVARLDDDAAQQIGDRHPVPDLDEHFGATFLPGLFADEKPVVQ